MRTTLTIDDRIARKLKQIALDSGRPFETVVNEVLEAGMAPKPGRKSTPFRLGTASLGGFRKGVDLDKALALSDSLEDDEIVRKMDLRKVKLAGTCQRHSCHRYSGLDARPAVYPQRDA